MIKNVHLFAENKSLKREAKNLQDIRKLKQKVTTKERKKIKAYQRELDELKGT